MARHTKNHVQQAPVPGGRIRAIDVPARIFKEMGVGMKGNIDDPITVFGGEANDVSKQHQPVPQPAGSQSNDEGFVMSRPQGFRRLTDSFGANLPGWPGIWQAFVEKTGWGKFSHKMRQKTTIPVSMIAFLRQLWGFVRPYRGRFFLGLLCGILYSLTNGVLLGAAKVVMDLIFTGSTNFHEQLAKNLAKTPHWIHPFTDRLVSAAPELPAPTSQLGWALVAGAIPAIVLLRNTLSYLSVYLTNWSAMHAIADIRTKLFSHLQNLSVGFFSRASTGDLIARITNDTQVLYSIVGSSFASAVKDPVTILCTLVVLLILQPTLTLVSIVVSPLCIVPIIIYGRKVRKSARAVQEHNAELTNLMHESFTGNRVIKAYNLEATVIEQFRATTRKYVSQMMRVIRSNEIPSQLMEFFGAAGIALVFLYIQHSMQFLPKDQQPKSSDFLTFVLTIVMIYPPIKALTRLHNQLHQARAASERVFVLLATKNSVPEPAQPKMLHASNADIEFQNLDFNYGEKPVLHNINLTVKAGQLVALVGASGSGKTTLANLLLRFYDPSGGVIKSGGVPLRDVSPRDLRNQIAVVAQENILFNDTIRSE